MTVLLALSGCSNRPKRLKAPDYNPATAADQAMSTYDTNGDGNLSGGELDACPGVRSALPLYDTDGNKVVSQEELLDRLRHLVQLKLALSPLRARVTLNGQKLEGAQVKLVPEAYLGNQIKPAFGTTNRAGSARLSVRPEDLPAAQRSYSGVHLGTYRVEITHPDKEIPAKYNTQTTLGCETIIGQRIVKFDLKS